MKYRVLLCLVGTAASASAAAEVTIGCNRMKLLLDPRLTPAIVTSAWASGVPRQEARAVLELRGCEDEILDRLTLDAPLARLDLVPLRGTPEPTYLVSIDLTAEAGSYNGPLTIPMQIVHDHLQPAFALHTSGKVEPIRLALTGKAAWRKAPVQNVDDLLFVSCQPLPKGFTTYYQRYHPTRYGWRATVRSEPGMWESDASFPKLSRFPSSLALKKSGKQR